MIEYFTFHPDSLLSCGQKVLPSEGHKKKTGYSKTCLICRVRELLLSLLWERRTIDEILYQLILKNVRLYWNKLLTTCSQSS